ncbi:hypothetical protein DB41_DM00060 [Neochlamydia sp. TUME1]|nr:hypothetical protein DB41_DM00060 [Neochlamydia sp. TUME1]
MNPKKSITKIKANTARKIRKSAKVFIKYKSLLSAFKIKIVK